MPLARRLIAANDIRAPEVSRGEAVCVSRYGNKFKVVFVNPEDFAMLEASHELVESLGRLDPSELDALTRKTLDLEDRPQQAPLEDYDAIVALLNQ